VPPPHIPKDTAVRIADDVLLDLSVTDIEGASPLQAFYWVGRLEAALMITRLALAPDLR
jgi:hypothetical protein